MFTRINSAWQALGVMLFLILVYLLVTNSRGAARVANAGTTGLATLFGVLQGRKAGGVR